MSQKNREDVFKRKILPINRWKRALNEKSKRRERRKRVGGTFRRVSKKTGSVFEVIQAPEEICLYTSIDKEASSTETVVKKTLFFFEQIEKKIPISDCTIDFGRTTRISAAAVVMLYATIERSLGNYKTKIIYPYSENGAEANKIIRKSYLDKLIKRNKISYNDLAESMQIPVISSYGDNLTDDIIDHIMSIISKKKPSLNNPETELLYSSAVIETIENVMLHAYPTKDSEENNKNTNAKWWLICSVINETLYLAILDQGVSIPATVIKKFWLLEGYWNNEKYRNAYNAQVTYEDKVNFFSGHIMPMADKEKIALAMTKKITGTRKEKHGKGSQSIKDLVSNSTDGKLWVFSRKGLYKFYSDDKKPEVIDLPIAVKGTLIQWSINLNENFS